MVRKSTKIKLPGLDQIRHKDPGTTTTASDIEKEKSVKDVASVKKKKKKNRAMSDGGFLRSQKDLGPRHAPITFPDLDKEVSDGSISDPEIPKIQKKEKDKKECPLSAEGKVTDSNLNSPGCNIQGVKLTESKKISCLRSDNHPYSTTEYLQDTAFSFIPSLFHPLNGQVSSAARHKEYIDYLKNSGFLKLFGTCILNVYRMWAWPPPEKLLEEMLNAMGHPVPARIQHANLVQEKAALHSKLRNLSKKRHEILKELDEYEDSRAHYDLLDPEEELQPLPEEPLVNYELMQEIFKNMHLVKEVRDSITSTGPNALSASDESAAFSFTYSANSNKSSSRRTDRT